MTSVLTTATDYSVNEKQYASFYVGGMLLAIDIQQVQEINRQLDVTVVPHSSDYVRGVINLRGDVATVIDLRKVLGLPASEVTRESRNLIVHSNGESVGLWVDKISDILTVPTDQINSSLSSFNDVEERFFSGVYTMESEIVVILNIEQVLAE